MLDRAIASGHLRIIIIPASASSLYITITHHDNRHRHLPSRSSSLLSLALSSFADSAIMTPPVITTITTLHNVTMRSIKR